jgi:hypothetical protein
VYLNGEAAPRVPEILNVSFEGVEGESLITALTSLAVTTGSACSSASGEPSYVLRALGRSTQLAHSSLRFSLGRATTEADIYCAAEDVIEQVERLRRVSPANVAATASAASVAQHSSKRRHRDAIRGVELDTLSPLARHYFDELPHAGVMTANGDGERYAGSRVVHGEAGSVADGAWVRFHLRVGEGIVKAALFQAWGCPHTLAVTAWLTEQLTRRPLTDLVPGTPAAWLKALDVPVEKLGRLLTVEDALKATLQPQA